MTECLFDLIKQGATVRQLQLVIESEKNLECRNDRQETPLMAAMLNIHQAAKREKIMLLLIEYNANINCLNARGQTPLMYACILNLTREIKILLNEPMIRYNAQDFEGNTALMYACAMGKLEAIEALVEAHCSGQINLDPYIMNLDGTSAFDYARDSSEETILKLLGRLITDNTVYNYDTEQNKVPSRKSKTKSRNGSNKKHKGHKSKRIQQLANDITVEIPESSTDHSDAHKVVVWKGDDNGQPTMFSEPESTIQHSAESDDIAHNENKIPKKKSVIMNIHLPKTYDEDFNTDNISTDAMSITEVRPQSKTQIPKCVVDEQIPSTSGLSASVNSSPKTKQRRRKGKRLRKKKRIQSENAKDSDLALGYTKPRSFGDEIAFCNKIYGADLYPCSAGPDDCYGDVDQMVAKLKRKVTGSMQTSYNKYKDDIDRTDLQRQTGKMDCLKLSASERAKLLSRTIWSVYGTPLPPIPITVETVHRVMSGITRLQHYLGKAKYQPGRLLSLDPEMWCIVESIKSESNNRDTSTTKLTKI